MSPSSDEKTPHPFGLRTIMELFDVGPAVAVASLTAAGVTVVLAVFFFVHSAPPTSITITSGPEGTSFHKSAVKYAKILEANGVKANVLISDGSLENLARLVGAHPKADVGFVQGGICDLGSDELVSLGSVSHQPMLVFYRGKPLELLSELKGKRIAIGKPGSGTHKIAGDLLKANGIEATAEGISHDHADDAAQALLDKRIDAAFVMSENVSIDLLKKLFRAPDIHLYNFKQAIAYSRKMPFLNVLELPEGAIEFGADIPPHEVTLIGPMVELVAVKGLHPALSDMLLEAATQVHNRPGIFQKRGEFPTPIEHSLRISDDAARFYKSGKSLLYRYFPFWLASLISRIIVVFLPTLVLLVPALKSVPAFFRWRTRIKIRRRYRELLDLERDFLRESRPTEQEAIRRHFERIDEAVHRMRIPPAYADQLYGLRGHIDYVRQLVARK